MSTDLGRRSSGAVRLMVCLVSAALFGVPINARGQPAIPPRLTLREAVALAVERNPTLVAARAGVDAAAADRLSASRRPNPAVTLDSEGYPLFESPRPTFWDNQEFTLRLDQEIETAGRRGLRVAIADADRRVASLTLRDRVRAVALEVMRAYTSASLAQADLTVAKASLEEIDRVIELNRARFQQGEISGAELRRLQVERLRFVEDVFAAELALKNARAAILALVGATSLDQPLEFTDALKAPDAVRMAAAAAPDTFGATLAQALAARPDVLAAREERARAETATRLQRAIRSPNITVGAGYRRTFATNAIVFGVTLPVPLFNQNQGGIARAAAELRAAEARSTAAEITVRLDVQRAANAAQTNRARVEYIEREHLTNAQEARDAVLRSYRLGETGLIDFLDAQRSFRDTQRTYNRALFDERLSQFELSAALGLPEWQLRDN